MIKAAKQQVCLLIWRCGPLLSPRMSSPKSRIIALATTIAALLQFTPAQVAEIAAPPPGATGLKESARLPQPKLAPASNEWQKALAGFRVAPNFKIDLFAAEPKLGN